MSRKKSGGGKAGISTALRQMQKAAAVLACIQLTAEYDNEVEADLADAIAVVLAIVADATAGIDAVASASDEEG